MDLSSRAISASTRPARPGSRTRPCRCKCASIWLTGARGRAAPSPWPSKITRLRLPRDAELIDDALGKINLFLTNVEYEQKPKGQQKLGGRPAPALEFTGEDPEHVLVEGECLAMAYRGFGYWFFTWGPQDEHDNLTDGWADLRQGFAIGKLREGWIEAPPKTLTLVGNKLPYQLDYVEDVWRKQELDGYDRRADAVLMGYDPKDKERGAATWPRWCRCSAWTRRPT